MSTSEVKEKVRKTLDRSEFNDLVTGGRYCDDEILAKIKGVFTFEAVSSERTEGSGDFDGWSWVFKIDDKFYEANGWYSSYDGATLDDAYDFDEVVQEEQTIKVWVSVK
jgi:hypothetical protein